MKIISLQPVNDKISVPTESRLLDSLIEAGCQVAMACGGQGVCATCHVKVLEGADSLTPPTRRELRTLSMITGSSGNSRLACQARVLGEGVVLEIPEGMFLQAAGDLLTLVGRRTEVPILHPRDGRVLIPKNKIITRSRILELEDEELDVLQLRNQSQET